MVIDPLLLPVQATDGDGLIVRLARRAIIYNLSCPAIDDQLGQYPKTVALTDQRRIDHRLSGRYTEVAQVKRQVHQQHVVGPLDHPFLQAVRIGTRPGGQPHAGHTQYHKRDSFHIHVRFELE